MLSTQGQHDVFNLHRLYRDDLAICKLERLVLDLLLLDIVGQAQNPGFNLKALSSFFTIQL